MDDIGTGNDGGVEESKATTSMTSMEEKKDNNMKKRTIKYVQQIHPELLKTKYWFLSFLRCRSTPIEHGEFLKDKMENNIYNQCPELNINIKKDNLLKILFQCLHSNLYQPIVEAIFSELKYKTVCFDVYLNVYFASCGIMMQKLLQRGMTFPSRSWWEYYWNRNAKHQRDIQHLFRRASAASIGTSTQRFLQQKNEFLTKINPEEWELVSAGSISEVYLNTQRNEILKCIKPVARERFDIEKFVVMKYFPITTGQGAQTSMINNSVHLWIEKIQNELDLKVEGENTRILSNVFFKKSLAEHFRKQTRINEKTTMYFIFELPKVGPFDQNFIFFEKIDGKNLASVWNQSSSMKKEDKEKLCLATLYFFYSLVEMYNKFKNATTEPFNFAFHTDLQLGNVMYNVDNVDENNVITVTLIDFGDSVMIDSKEKRKTFEEYFKCLYCYLTGHKSYSSSNEKIATILEKKWSDLFQFQLWLAFEKYVTLVFDLCSKISLTFIRTLTQDINVSRHTYNYYQQEVLQRSFKFFRSMKKMNIS